MQTTFLDDLAAWWSTVSPEFAFLLALPFMVAALGIAADCIRRHRRGRDQT
jgi:hypothetical protein